MSFPAALAQRGYAVIVIDMFYHGERRLILDDDLENHTNDRSKPEPEETIRKINQRASKIGTDADYDEKWGNGR